jgi:hypothetical protein
VNALFERAVSVDLELGAPELVDDEISDVRSLTPFVLRLDRPECKIQAAPHIRPFEVLPVVDAIFDDALDVGPGLVGFPEVATSIALRSTHRLLPH